jgi:hypothetical protein
LPLLEHVKFKATLLALLPGSHCGDANGIVNIAREKEMKETNRYRLKIFAK